MNKVIVSIVPLLLFFFSIKAQEKKDTIYTVSPIEITATYATPRLSPVTFSNIEQKDIQRLHSTQDIPLILSELPSIIAYSENGNGLGYNYINLRGFDQRRLSVMINGIPQNDPEDHNVYWIDFPDLLSSSSTIQVQRGAGSAFYGPPAIGGSVNIIAVPFKATPYIEIENLVGFQEYGSSNTVVLSTRKHTATFNSGLVNERYMFYGRIGKTLSTGYRDKSWVDISSYFFGAKRIDETMSTRFHFYGGPFSDGLVYNGLPKFYNKDKTLRRKNYSYFNLNNDKTAVRYATERRPQETEEFSQPHFEVLHDWKLNDNVTLYNTVFYIQGDGHFDFDGSWADTSMLRIGSLYGYPTTTNPENTIIRSFVGNKQVGWLPRIEIVDDVSTYIIGAEIRQHRSLHWGKIRYAENLPQNYDPDYRFYEYYGSKDVISLYGHSLTVLSEKWKLMADLQLVYNRYAIDKEKYLSNNFSLSYFFVNPRVGLNYNIDEHLNSYVNVAYTTREPRLKNLYDASGSYYGETPNFKADVINGVVHYDFKNPIAKPEKLLNVEAGVGYRTSDIFLAVNAFWMEFFDELIKKGEVDIWGQPVTGNAERTRHVGLEIEGLWKLNKEFSFGGNATLMQNRLIKYSVMEKDANGVLYRRSLNGNPIAGAPDYLLNIAMNYERNDFYATLRGKYVGEFYTDNTKNPLMKNEAYWVWNALGQYLFKTNSGLGYGLRLEVRNIFNNLYTMNGEGDEFYPAAERNYVIGITIQF